MQPMLVDRHVEQGRSERLEDPPRPGVARVFEHHHVVGLDQQARDQVDRLLGPGRDDDLLRRYSRPRAGPGTRQAPRAATAAAAVRTRGRRGRSGATAARPRAATRRSESGRHRAGRGGSRSGALTSARRTGPARSRRRGGPSSRGAARRRGGRRWPGTPLSTVPFNPRSATARSASSGSSPRRRCRTRGGSPGTLRPGADRRRRGRCSGPARGSTPARASRAARPWLQPLFEDRRAQPAVQLAVQRLRGGGSIPSTRSTAARPATASRSTARRAWLDDTPLSSMVGHNQASAGGPGKRATDRGGRGTQVQMRAETRAALAAVDTALELVQSRAPTRSPGKGGRDLVTAPTSHPRTRSGQPPGGVSRVDRRRGGARWRGSGGRPAVLAGGPDLRHPELRL